LFNILAAVSLVLLVIWAVTTRKSKLKLWPAGARSAAIVSNAISMASFMVCVAAGVFWARSSGGTECLAWNHSDRDSGLFCDISFRNFRGAFAVNWGGFRTTPSTLKQLPYLPQNGWGYDREKLISNQIYLQWPRFSFAGFEYGDTDYVDNWGDSHFPVLSREAAVPLWFVMIVFGTWPIVKLVRIVRHRRDVPGHCRRCGYDLRATPERCPECGAENHPLSHSNAPLE
jgi:hypothetical protein